MKKWIWRTVIICVAAVQDPETGDWTVDLWSRDRERHETVYISADGTEGTIASGTIYR